ncbi:hypothetical protein D3C83_95920 [compost metagenome]
MVPEIPPCSVSVPVAFTVIRPEDLTKACAVSARTLILVPLAVMVPPPEVTRFAPGPNVMSPFGVVTETFCPSRRGPRFGANAVASRKLPFSTLME